MCEVIDCNIYLRTARVVNRFEVTLAFVWKFGGKEKGRALSLWGWGI